MKISWPREGRKSREFARRLRRQAYVTRERPLLLDDYECAEFLGLPVRKVRQLVKNDRMNVWQERPLFDVEHVHEYALRNAMTDTERRHVIIRRVRFEAHDLENYPDAIRADIMPKFLKMWEQFAEDLDQNGYAEDALAVRSILRQAEMRLGDVMAIN